MSYTNSSKCWVDLMDPVINKTKITTGNHEWPISLFMEYAQKFNLTYPYYAFNIDNIHVLSLNNEFSYDKHSSQYDFARDDLAKSLQSTLR